MVLVILRGDTNRTHDYTLKGFMGICGSQRMPYSLLGGPCHWQEDGSVVSSFESFQDCRFLGSRESDRWHSFILPINAYGVSRCDTNQSVGCAASRRGGDDEFEASLKYLDVEGCISVTEDLTSMLEDLRPFPRLKVNALSAYCIASSDQSW